MIKNLDKKNHTLFQSLDEKFISAKTVELKIIEINNHCKKFDVVTIINVLLQSLANVKYYSPNNSTHNKISIFKSSKFDYSIIHNPGKTHINNNNHLYTYTNDAFLCPLITIPDSKYSIYEQSQILNSSKLNKEAKLCLKEKNTFVEYNAIYFRKFKDVLKLDKTKSQLMLMISPTEPGISFTWEYNSETLKPIRIVLANINIARLCTTSKILGSIGNENSKDLLLKLCNHKSHLVRWEAVRSLINIDFDEGLKVLNRFTSDEHQEVCDASTQSLKILEKI